MTLPSQRSAVKAPGRTLRGGTVSAWLAAILAGVLGIAVGFGRIEAATAAGGHATGGHRAGGSAAPPPLQAPGGNSPPAQHGQEQGPKEAPRPSQPPRPGSPLSSKNGRNKARSDQERGAGEAVPGAELATDTRNEESTPSISNATESPMGVTAEPNGRRVGRGHVSRSLESPPGPEFPGMEEEAWLERWRARKDETAFGSLISHQRPALLSYARRFVDEDSAQDLVALAFECLCSQPIQVKDAAHLHAWLRRVVRRHAIDHARKLGRIILMDPDWFDGQLHAPQPERGCRRLEQLAAAMAMLRPGEPEILLWRYGEDLRCAEIASRLRVSLRTAKRKLADARQRVKAAMEIVEKRWHDLAGSNV